jgi:hypothetical protein
MSWSIERRFYRLDFPERERPGFVISDHPMPVHEISERGLRYEPLAGHAPIVGERVQGRVAFRHAGDFDVAGAISRTQGDTVVVVLDPPGLPYASIMEEQRFLMRRYPERFRRNG